MSEALAPALVGFRDYLAGLQSGSPASSLFKDVFWTVNEETKRPVNYPCAILRIRGMRPHTKPHASMSFVDIEVEVRVDSPARDAEDDVIGDKHPADDTTVAFMGIARVVEKLVQEAYYLNRTHNVAIISCIRYLRADSPTRDPDGYVSQRVRFEGELKLAT